MAGLKSMTPMPEHSDIDHAETTWMRLQLASVRNHETFEMDAHYVFKDDWEISQLWLLFPFHSLHSLLVK